MSSSKKETKSSYKESIMSGFLLKKGARRKNWLKRWFILEAGVMKYYKREVKDINDAGEPIGSFYIRNCPLVNAISTKYLNALSIETPERMWYLRAENRTEYLAWKEKLVLNGAKWRGTTEEETKEQADLLEDDYDDTSHDDDDDDDDDE